MTSPVPKIIKGKTTFIKMITHSLNFYSLLNSSGIIQMFYHRKHQLNRRITSIQLKRPKVDSLDIWLLLYSALLSPRGID